MFENKKVGKREVHMSRYIASWRNVGGEIDYGDEHFREWLLSEGLSEQDISDATEMALCGKFELEMEAEKYVKQQRKDLEDYMKTCYGIE